MEPFSPSHNKQSYSPHRTRVKVLMQGFLVGRSVDLMVFDGYDHLIDELDKMFELNGELRSTGKWEIVYTDNLGDMMHVGDDVWIKFCNMAKRLLIRSSQDVKKMLASSAQGDTSSDLSVNS